MQKRVKLSVIKENQINAVYGLILDLNPLTIQSEQANVFQEKSIIIFPENVDNSREIYILEVKNILDNTVIFEKVKRIDDVFFKNHYIEFNHTFSIAEVISSNELKYKSLAANINRQELNSTASRLKEGILFACKKNIAADKIFLYTTIRDSSGFFSFAALCSVEKLMYSGEYIIYKGVFFDLNFDTKDKIMKYIFKLEREMLKEANK